MSSPDHFGAMSDFAEKRFKLAEILYYKVLENVMVQELRRLQGKDMAVSKYSPAAGAGCLATMSPYIKGV